MAAAGIKASRHAVTPSFAPGQSQSARDVVRPVARERRVEFSQKGVEKKRGRLRCRIKSFETKPPVSRQTVWRI